MSTEDLKEQLKRFALRKRLETLPRTLKNAHQDALVGIESYNERVQDILHVPPEEKNRAYQKKIQLPNTKKDLGIYYELVDNGIHQELLVDIDEKDIIDYLASIPTKDFDHYCDLLDKDNRGLIKNKFPHGNFTEDQYFILADALIQDDPFVGAALFLRCVENKTMRQDGYTMWTIDDLFDRSCEAGGNCVIEVNRFFEKFARLVDDELSSSFLDDFKRDVLDLIFRASKMALELVLQPRDPSLAPNVSRKAFTPKSHYVSIISRFAYPLSEEEYDSYNEEIEKLYAKIKLFVEKAHIPDNALFLERQHQAKGKTYEINVPFMLGQLDISQFLIHYAQFWKQLADDLQNLDTARMRKGGDMSSVVEFPDGASILLRARAVKDRLGKKDARILIKPFGDENDFDIRIDRDEFVQSLSFDYGTLRFEYVLAFLNEILDVPSLESNFMNLDILVLAKDVSHSQYQIKQVSLRNKLAFFVSVIMHRESQSRRSAGDEGASYHVRKHIAKEEYYNNFSHVVAELEKALSSRIRRGTR